MVYLGDYFPFLDCFEQLKRAASTDEDAVRFAQSQQIGILESEGESLGGKQVDTGDASVETDARQIVDVPVATEQSAVSRAVDEICAGVESPPDDRFGRELQGELGDVVPVSSSVTSKAEAHVSRKTAGFGEIDTDDSSADESDRNSGDAPPEANSARGDDDGGSVHSSAVMLAMNWIIYWNNQVGCLAICYCPVNSFDASMQTRHFIYLCFLRAFR